MIKKSGNYYVQKTDFLYETYSGYKFIVCWGRGFCYEQLKGFKEENNAILFMEEKAIDGKEDKNYESIKEKMSTMDSFEWKHRCLECGGNMDFNEANFTYICSCGNRLEV